MNAVIPQPPVTEPIRDLMLPFLPPSRQEKER